MNLTRPIVFLCDASPFLRKCMWRWWYGKLARRIPEDGWTFMNYGFVPLAAGSAPSRLDPGDASDRLCIQLYERVVSPADLKGKDVLEVGCGRGGGASFLARYHRSGRVVGIDFSPQTIAFARQRHQDVPNLAFAVGDAEKLVFPDASFDAVINVESSHCYGDPEKFFREAARVLRPGGYFLFADLRGAADMPALEALLGAVFAAGSGWERIGSEDITPNVIAALEADDIRKREMIEQFVPTDLRGLFKEFAGISGGQVFDSLRKGDLAYFRFAFRRKA